MTPNGDLEVTHAGERFPMQRHLVERQRLPAPLITPHHAHHQIAAFLDRPLLGQHHLQSAIQIPEIGLCQKTEMTGVDGEDRHPHRCGLARRRQHRAIPPQHDGEGHGVVEPVRDTGAVTEQTQVLVRIGESDHPTGAAGPHDAVPRVFKPVLNRVSGIDR